MKDLKLINTEKLVDVIKQINPILVKADKKPIATSKGAKATLVDCFTKAVEGFPEDTKLPKAVIQFYNDVYADEIDQPATEEPKTKKGKTAAAKPAKAAKEPKEKKETLPRDKYGFREGSNGNMLMEALSTGPMKMAEIKVADWNKSHITFYELFAKLKAEGILDMNDEKQLFIVKAKKK